MDQIKKDLIRVFIKGGILSPEDLLRIMEASRKMGNKYILFGSRQDILFPSNDSDAKDIELIFDEMKFDYEIGKSGDFQNIVTSYVAVNVENTTHWVKEDTYHYVIDNFDYTPKLKINVVDPNQSIVPLFTGQLNFIASKTDNYWHLYIRVASRNDKLEKWPRMIYTQDIATVSKAIEDNLSFNPKMSIEELYLILQGTLKISQKKSDDDIQFPENIFPYYEGLNGMLNNAFWLGLYWRNNEYAIDFLTAACKLCQETHIGKICIIPWKAFIIKNIKANDRIRWEKLMGKFGINMRHSSLELNWHLPVKDADAIELKRYLVRELDQQDISTHGLTFTVKTTPDLTPFTSIVIEKSTWLVQGDNIKYNILYAKDFNPNNDDYYYYAKEIQKEIIPALLIELSKIFFRQLNPEREEKSSKSQLEKTLAMAESYQCSNCLTIYDQKFGDPDAQIAPGTHFEELPDDYHCHVCEGSKEDFRPVVDY